ncbi:MAG: PrsW family glutamic-type intramembrane protease [Candidatus Yanofskybacteria bacterium]|nr:PrsW family glutamic-type intramembrane protease [Candidatus Yanofskybacteria bacterium]
MPAFLYYSLLVAMGMLPSLIWLSFYLRKDAHPEPKYLITKTFLMGIILSPFAVLFQRLFVEIVSAVAPTIIQTRGIGFFMWAAFIEEMVKFLAVYFIVLKSPEFDEPADAMIYLITAGLGFAAMENILVLFKVVPDGFLATGALADAVRIWALRFIGATLLHALSSALIGYFLGLAWFFDHHHKKLILAGIIMATLFHFTFNMFISASTTPELSLFYATSLLIGMAFLVSILFDKIKERHLRSANGTIS